VTVTPQGKAHGVTIEQHLHLHGVHFDSPQNRREFAKMVSQESAKAMHAELTGAG
jgi:hypothetical protein